MLSWSYFHSLWVHRFLLCSIFQFPTELVMEVNLEG